MSVLDNNSETVFLIELPADEYGNRAMTGGEPSVVEVKTKSDGGFDIVSPSDFPWSSVHRYYADRWIECDGPARVLDGGDGEREAIIAMSFRKKIRTLNARIAELSK